MEGGSGEKNDDGYSDDGAGCDNDDCGDTDASCHSCCYGSHRSDRRVIMLRG